LAGAARHYGWRVAVLPRRPTRSLRRTVRRAVVACGRPLEEAPVTVDEDERPRVVVPIRLTTSDSPRSAGVAAGSIDRHAGGPDAMISITTKSPYAVAALVELARTGGDAPVPIGELARRREIPVQFLEQLFAVLRRAGVLRSQRGVKGGYRFDREPADVTVLEVVELLDGPLGRDAQGVFAAAATAARDVLARTSIADEVEREVQQAAAPMYYI
jgi:DNA-binding IscR family transcriptional regulator